MKRPKNSLRISCAGRKRRRILSSRERLKKRCDDLWAECVKARAGYKSELSELRERLTAHHIKGKGTYRLRYELDNGICITAGEHRWGIHNPNRHDAYQKRIDDVIGSARAKKLEVLSLFRYAGGTDLAGVKLYLERELKKCKETV